MTEIAGVDAGRLKSVVERIERLHEEKRSLEQDIAEVYSEAHDAGLDKKIVKQVVKRRRLKPDVRELLDETVALYERAIKGPSGQTPLNAAARTAGFADGQDDCRANAGKWPSGEYGHADYELGWEDGHAQRLDALEASRARERPVKRAFRQRIEAHARARAEA